MENPIEIEQDRIRFNYLKKITFKDYRDQIKKKKKNVIIFGLILVFFVYSFLFLAPLYLLEKDKSNLWSEVSLIFGKEECQSIGETFINMRVVEIFNQRVIHLTCSSTSKLIPIDN